MSRLQHVTASQRRHGLFAPTSIALSCIKLILLGLGCIPFARAVPFQIPSRQTVFKEAEDEPKPPTDAALWVYLAIAMALVLLGGALAGLTIA
jgi:metal transporter CNNM